jgi:hypothetical protein
MPTNIIPPNTTKQFGPSTSKAHYNPEYSFSLSLPIQLHLC